MGNEVVIALANLANSVRILSCLLAMKETARELPNGYEEIDRLLKEVDGICNED